FPPYQTHLSQIVAPPGALTTLEQTNPPTTTADSFYSVCVGPAFFIGGVHPAMHAQMLILPYAVHLDVVILVMHGEPPRLVVLAEGEETKTIPYALCPVPCDLDERIHHHVVREAYLLLGALEQLANGLMALCCAQATFPNTIFDEQRSDFVWVMILVTYRAIARLQLLDGLDVLEPGQALFELRHLHCEHSFSGCNEFLGTC